MKNMVLEMTWTAILKTANGAIYKEVFHASHDHKIAWSYINGKTDSEVLAIVAGNHEVYKLDKTKGVLKADHSPLNKEHISTY